METTGKNFKEVGTSRKGKILIYMVFFFQRIRDASLNTTRDYGVLQVLPL
jgi:hypothetical protein